MTPDEIKVPPSAAELADVALMLQRAGAGSMRGIITRLEFQRDTLAAEVKQLRESIQAAPIGAVGYGLNAMQQKAIADLFVWQKESLNSAIRIGGAAKAAKEDEGPKDTVCAVVANIVDAGRGYVNVELAPGGTTIAVLDGETLRRPRVGDVLRIRRPKVLEICDA